MTGRRVIIGLCMLCALIASAVAAQGASAATKGTTGTAPAGTGYTGNITGTGETWILHSVISGVTIEIVAHELNAEGVMESMLAGTGEHTSNGTGVGHFTNVTVTKPAGKGCTVKNGTIITNELKATTAGQGMGVKFEPNSGPTLATFEIDGCTIAPLNGHYEVTGSVIGTPVEGTNETVFTGTETTTQGTLKLRGQKAGIEGVLKLKTSGGTAINASTVETP